MQKSTVLRAAAVILVIAAMLTVFSSCAEKKYEGTINVIALKGPTGMGMSKLMDDDESGKTFNDYSFTLSSAPDQVSAALIKGECDIAALPINLAAKLYAKNEKSLQMIAVNTLGVLYVLENGNSIKSVADLKGKTIGATGQGSTPEYILRYILSANGIDPDKDVTINYEAEHAALASLVVSGGVDIAMLPEPNVTSVLASSDKARIALSLNDEWQKINSDVPTVQGCIVVRKDFCEKNPDAVKKFLDEYKASVEYVTSNVKEASLLIEKFGIVPKAQVAEKALPNCNICFIEGSKMKDTAEKTLKVFFDADASSIGGEMPDSGFYYSR